MEHTPGEWFVDDGETMCFGIFSKDDLQAICYLSENPQGGYGLRGVDTDRANARLMAAAPKMLRALEAQKQAKYLEDEADFTGDDGKRAGARQARFTANMLTDEAIKAATGK